MEISERGIQRKKLNNDFRQILKDTSPEMDPASDPDDLDVGDVNIGEEVGSLEHSQEQCLNIIPCLEDVHIDSTNDEATCADTDLVAESQRKTDIQRKKKPQRKQKHNPIRQQLRMGMSIKEIQKGGAMNVPQAVGRQGFARAIAVCFNSQTGSLTCGLSGKLRKVRIHPQVWGKSVEPGRPRGTCAEFKVVNTALLAGEQISDLVINVVDIATNKPKPRCRNCALVTNTACVLSDDL